MGQPADPQKFAALFVRSQRRVYGYILTVVPDGNEADEVFQETSLILWKRADDFDPDADFVRWACGIAMNVIRNRRVKQARDRHIFSDALLENIVAVRQARASWIEERTSLLADCMARLNDSQRQLLRLFYGGRAQADRIASERGVSVNTLYQRLHRIRRRLFQCVSQLHRAEGAQ